MAANSQIVSKTISISDMIIGETSNISFTLKNNGDVPWYGGVVSLRYVNSDTALWDGIDDLFYQWYGWWYPWYGNNIGVNQTSTLSFNVTPPANIAPGIYTLKYRLYWYWDESTQYWFGETIEFQIIVRESPISEFVSFQFEDSLEVAKRGTALITFKNTSIWTWNKEFRIEYDSSDALKFSRAYYYIPLTVEVPTNGEYTFRIPMRAPPEPGTYQICFRLWWHRCGTFGETGCKTVEVTMPTSPVEDLNDYNWQNLSCRRSTADIAWQYGITLDGSERPPDFGRLYHEIDGICALHGELTEFSVNVDYPAISTELTAYSFGHFLNNYLPVKIPDTDIFLRQSRAGSDIKTWQKADSNIATIQLRTEEIKTYENPSHYLARILFYVDDETGKIDTTRPGPYGLWATDVLSSAEELIATGGIPTFRAVPNWGIAAYSGSDGNQYMLPADAPSGVTTTINTGFNTGHPNQEEPAMIEKKQFSFDGETVMGVLETLAEHCHMLFYTRFIKVDGFWREYLYWIPKYGVELGWLGIDQTVQQITPNTIGLIGSPGVSASISLEQSYNAVWVEACRKKDSAWFYAYKPGGGVIAGIESPRVLIYRSHDLLPDTSANNWTTSITVNSNFGPCGVNYGNATENANCQAIVERKAESLINYLEYQIPTYTVVFENRFFELYQILQFSGFQGLESFNGFDMQIIDIEYNFNPPDEGGHEVTITCAPRIDLQKSGKFQSVVDEIRENFEKLKESIESSETNDKLSVIISTYAEGSMCNAQLRSSGLMVKTRTYGYKTASG